MIKTVSETLERLLANTTGLNSLWEAPKSRLVNQKAISAVIGPQGNNNRFGAGSPALFERRGQVRVAEMPGSIPAEGVIGYRRFGGSPSDACSR